MQQTAQLINQQLVQNQSVAENNFTEAIDKLSQTSSEIFMKADNELNSTFKRLAVGVDLMNDYLKQLGQQQIGGGKKKKGFFGR